MSEGWNLETVADSKPEAPPEKPSEEGVTAAIPSVLSNDQSLGKIMAMTRETRGISLEQAAKTSNIPAYYLTMIESDDYSSIADQLYLLPFLRRYATFIGMEPEEVASRFIREVQRADMNPGRGSDPEPIVIIDPRATSSWSIVVYAGAALVVLALGWFGYRYYVGRKSASSNSSHPSDAEQLFEVTPSEPGKQPAAAASSAIASPAAASSAIASPASPMMSVVPAVAAPQASASVSAAATISAAPAATPSVAAKGSHGKTKKKRH
jgi:cytoskeleton protein RodZ